MFPVGSLVVRKKKKTIFILSIPVLFKGTKIPYQYMNTNRSYGYDIIIRETVFCVLLKKTF